MSRSCGEHLCEHCDDVGPDDPPTTGMGRRVLSAFLRDQWSTPVEVNETET